MAFTDNPIARQPRLAAVAALAAALAVAAPALSNAQTAQPPAAPRPAGPAPSPQAMPSQNGAAPAQAASQGANATQGDTETVEQRIASLHAALKITPAQEPKWQAVAKAMRENAAAMDKLNGEAQGMDPQKMTAVQSLVTYQKFARAHVDGLKNLTDDFRALYSAMPPDQKRTADEVFRTASQ